MILNTRVTNYNHFHSPYRPYSIPFHTKIPIWHYRTFRTPIACDYLTAQTLISPNLLLDLPFCQKHKETQLYQHSWSTQLGSHFSASTMHERPQRTSDHAITVFNWYHICAFMFHTVGMACPNYVQRTSLVPFYSSQRIISSHSAYYLYMFRSWDISKLLP